MRSHRRNRSTFHNSAQQSLRISGDKPADGVYSRVEQGRAKGRTGADEHDMGVFGEGQQVRKTAIG